MFGGMTQFVHETRQELKKVSWPSREELMGSTVVVVVTTFILAAYIGAIDFVLSVLIRLVIR